MCKSEPPVVHKIVTDKFCTSIVISRRWYLDCSCPTWIHAGIQRAKAGEPRVILFTTVWLTLSNVTINKVGNLESNSVAMQASPVGLWVCGYVLDRYTRKQTEVRIRISAPHPHPHPHPPSLFMSWNSSGLFFMPRYTHSRRGLSVQWNCSLPIWTQNGLGVL